MPKLVAVYDRPDRIASAAARLKGRGYTDIETYAPAPFPEVEDAVLEKPSGVRAWTLVGGLTGVVTGYALTLWMANDWPIMLGGKPFSSIPPYTIIGFELTILFGGVLTVLGLFTLGRLYPRKLDPAYDARFSGEEFGLVVACRERDVREVEDLMRAEGASEVTLVER
jgi:molybdopterin-containing oxidoreductase family membrane subunit